MTKLIHQGDVLFIPINNIPEGCVEKKDLIVAKGEFTGHHHSFESETATLYQNEGSMFAILTEDSLLTHQEHNHMMIPKGTYEVKIQREEDLLGQIHLVRD